MDPEKNLRIVMGNKFEGNSTDPKFNNSEDYLSFITKYEQDNPVVIPDHILELIKKQQEENDDPNLTYERWKELGEERERSMKGSTDDDLYYQLYYAKKYGRVLVPGLEARLRTCYCGSGKKFNNCHGK